MDKNEQSIHTCLQRISNMLLINGGFLPNLGLYSGDMGVVLFFYRYARLMQNEIYSEFSSYLMERVQNKLHQFTPVNYIQGLTGIGSTIEYLAQNGYLNANTDDMLGEFDKRIFFTYNLSNLQLTYIMDIGYYALWRMAGQSVLKDTIYKSVLPQILHVMMEWKINQSIINSTISFFIDIFSSTIFKDERSIISDWHKLCRNNNIINGQLQEYDPTISLSKFDFGIQNGLSGLGLSLISKLDGDDSWLSLFPNDLITCQK
jgi:hypothetical protein